MIGLEDSAIPESLRLLAGCRIRTHYGTGGVVTKVEGPWDNGCYIIEYAHPYDGKPCWINTVRIEDGVITCEHKPLIIEGRERQVQISLFD